MPTIGLLAAAGAAEAGRSAGRPDRVPVVRDADGQCTLHGFSRVEAVATAWILVREASLLTGIRWSRTGRGANE